MNNAYNTSSNYYNNFNKNLLNQKAFRILKKEPNHLKSELSRNSLQYTSNKLDNILSKALSKEKRRGILDVCSPGNKDILIDSDSECPSNRKIKYNDITNDTKAKKNKCTKLIIDKIESQKPKINEEYYKFTNQKINYNYNNSNLRNKILENNQFSRFKSPIDIIYSNKINNYFNINNDNNKDNKLGKRKTKNLIINPKKYENFIDNNNLL